MRLFETPGDYGAFIDLMALTQREVPMRCLAYCLMPNHFHLVLWPTSDGALSRFMFRLTTIHSIRWNAFRGQTGSGHVYQGRFKAFPVHQDRHFLQVCRYVERNALRAGLAVRAEDWPWSSLAQRCGAEREVALTDWPVLRPSDWLSIVQAENADEVSAVRHSLFRGAPYGPDTWRQEIALKLGLGASLRPEGKPGHKTTQEVEDGYLLP